uniref:Uncharacterized protein n=1 Tax=viral metagenome TaxID=1070528 RepID=A0A6H1Z9E2_9ZZZZ
MVCFICRQKIQTSHRTFIASRNKKEKDRFRDLCESCYEENMNSKGYIKIRTENNITLWQHQEVNHAWHG